MEAERFVYYLLPTLAGWAVAMALEALGKHYPPMKTTGFRRRR